MTVRCSDATEARSGPACSIVGYVEVGPGPTVKPVLLLHGWPYDIHSFADVAPPLADAGYRVVVPYLRGYGTTRFLSDDTIRNGQQAALAVDAIALMDALGIDLSDHRRLRLGGPHRECHRARSGRSGARRWSR